MNDIKAKVLTSIRSKEEHMVILKPDDDVNMQIILSVMEDFNNSKISNMLLGIKDNTDDDQKTYDPTSRKSKAGVILGKPVQ